MNIYHRMIFTTAVMAPVDPLSVLSNELIHAVFVELDLGERFRCQRVSKSWRNFITSDHSLWTSSIDFYRCQLVLDKPQVLERCLNYACGGSEENVIINDIVIWPGFAEGCLRLLSKDLVNQCVARINYLTVSYPEEDGKREFYEHLPTSVDPLYHLVPVSNLETFSYRRTIFLDKLLESQKNSLETLSIMMKSLNGHKMNSKNTISTYPLVNYLDLRVHHISDEAILCLSRCPNITQLKLTKPVDNVYRGEEDEDDDKNFIAINNLMNNISNTLQSLELGNFKWVVDPAYGRCSWPESLSSLTLWSVEIDSYDHMFGSLKGLKNLKIQGGSGNVGDLFNLFDCGPNLETLLLYAVKLGPGFSSHYPKLAKLEDVDIWNIRDYSRQELFQVLFNLAKNGAKRIHIGDREFPRLDIKKITDLGAIVDIDMWKSINRY